MDIEKDSPRCVKKLIRQGKLTPCDQANVKEYIFQGQTVFVFYPGNCGADWSTEVVDSDCNSIGSLGGFNANTQINGVNFSANATYVKTIWSN
jgi:hypothetical protein